LRGDSARADVVRGPWTRRVAIAGSLAAAIVLAWCGGAWWSRPGAQQQLGAEVISAHVRSLVGDHLIDVQSSDRHTVNPWFQGKVPFAPGARDFTPLGFALAGGRLDYLDGRTVAALVYRHGPHSINVFVWPAEEDGDERVTNFGARGYSACHWVQDGLIHWAVTDADASTLTKLVDLLRAKD
jgi:anti-sigma factor RsiW